LPVEPKPVILEATALEAAEAGAAAKRFLAFDIKPVSAPAMKPRLLTNERRVDLRWSMGFLL
jgi:hypothetical protein